MVKKEIKNYTPSPKFNFKCKKKELIVICFCHFNKTCFPYLIFQLVTI